MLIRGFVTINFCIFLIWILLNSNLFKLFNIRSWVCKSITLNTVHLNSVWLRSVYILLMNLMKLIVRVCLSWESIDTRYVVVIVGSSILIWIIVLFRRRNCLNYGWLNLILKTKIICLSIVLYEKWNIEIDSWRRCLIFIFIDIITILMILCNTCISVIDKTEFMSLMSLMNNIHSFFEKILNFLKVDIETKWWCLVLKKFICILVDLLNSFLRYFFITTLYWFA